MTYKVLLITNIPNPYRIPLFNELYFQLERECINLHVAFGAPGYERRKFTLDMADCKFRYTILATRSIRYRDSERTSFTYSGLYKLIREFRPDLIITNAFSIATLKLWLRSWFACTTYIIWSGAIEGGRCSPARKLLRRMLVARARGFVAYGTMAREYLVSLGARRCEVSIGINTVDTAFFGKHSDRDWQKISRQQPRRLACISYLTPRKRVDQLLLAIRELARLRSDFCLYILGDGPDRSKLEKMAKDLNIEKHVVFKGFIQKEAIPDQLSRAEILLFPTEFDVWGLVLVEAMAAGVPCIASIRAGATVDLVEEGKTGYAADFSDSGYVADKINWMLEHPQEAASCGVSAAANISRNVSLGVSAAGFAERILICLNSQDQ